MNSNKSSSETASEIRVLVANLTGMIAEMIQEILQQQPNITLVNEIKKLEEIDAALADIDVLVVGVRDVYSPPEACFRFLSNYPNLKILLLTTTHDEAIAYWRALHCHPMQVTSSQSLVEAIRQLYSLSPF